MVWRSAIRLSSRRSDSAPDYSSSLTGGLSSPGPLTRTRFLHKLSVEHSKAGTRPLACFTVADSFIESRTSRSAQGLVPYSEVALGCQRGAQVRMQYLEGFS
jgi:hypothetical protein